VLERKEPTYPVNQILPLLKVYPKKGDCIDLEGDSININSLRLRLFAREGVSCVHCKVSGVFFAKERHRPDQPWHLNLYGYHQDGTEVLMTKDHVVPVSKGGGNKPANLQVLCARCNHFKGSQKEFT